MSYHYHLNKKSIVHNKDIHPSEIVDGVPVFRPSMDEFKDFYEYVQSINHYGMESGIVKVVPPKEWHDLQKITPELLSKIMIEKPIEQDISSNKLSGNKNGIFITNIEKNKKYNMIQWKELSYDYPLPLRALHNKGTSSSTSSSGTTGQSQGQSQIQSRGNSNQNSRSGTPVSSFSMKSRSSSPVRKRNAKVTSKKYTDFTLDDFKEFVDSGNYDYDYDTDNAFNSNNVHPFTDISSDGTEKSKNSQAQDQIKALEEHYWKNLLLSTPVYGADSLGSLFDPDMEIWNVSKLPNLLDLLNDKIPGVNQSYLYAGLWKSTFSWHLEDQDLHSINYLHFGCPKQWYSIPQADADKFYNFMKEIFPDDYNNCEDFLRHKTFHCNPKVLTANGITVNKIVHNPGEFMITFPYGYHSGFNYGYNLAESVNFALEDWLDIGIKATNCKCIDDSVSVNVKELKQTLKENKLKRKHLEKLSNAATNGDSPQRKKLRSSTISSNGTETPVNLDEKNSSETLLSSGKTIKQEQEENKNLEVVDKKSLEFGTTERFMPNNNLESDLIKKQMKYEDVKKDISENQLFSSHSFNGDRDDSRNDSNFSFSALNNSSNIQLHSLNIGLNDKHEVSNNNTNGDKLDVGTEVKPDTSFNSNMSEDSTNGNNRNKQFNFQISSSLGVAENAKGKILQNGVSTADSNNNNHINKPTPLSHLNAAVNNGISGPPGPPSSTGSMISRLSSPLLSRIFTETDPLLDLQKRGNGPNSMLNNKIMGSPLSTANFQISRLQEKSKLSDTNGNTNTSTIARGNINTSGENPASHRANNQSTFTSTLVDEQNRTKNDLSMTMTTSDSNGFANQNIKLDETTSMLQKPQLNQQPSASLNSGMFSEMQALDSPTLSIFKNDFSQITRFSSPTNSIPKLNLNTSNNTNEITSNQPNTSSFNRPAVNTNQKSKFQKNSLGLVNTVTTSKTKNTTTNNNNNKNGGISTVSSFFDMADDDDNMLALSLASMANSRLSSPRLNLLPLNVNVQGTSMMGNNYSNTTPTTARAFNSPLTNYFNNNSLESNNGDISVNNSFLSSNNTGMHANHPISHLISGQQVMSPKPSLHSTANALPSLGISNSGTPIVGASTMLNTHNSLLSTATTAAAVAAQQAASNTLSKMNQTANSSSQNQHQIPIIVKNNAAINGSSKSNTGPYSPVTLNQNKTGGSSSGIGNGNLGYLNSSFSPSGIAAGRSYGTGIGPSSLSNPLGSPVGVSGGNIIRPKSPQSPYLGRGRSPNRVMLNISRDGSPLTGFQLNNPNLNSNPHSTNISNLVNPHQPSITTSLSQIVADKKKKTFSTDSTGNNLSFTGAIAAQGEEGQVKKRKYTKKNPTKKQLKQMELQLQQLKNQELTSSGPFASTLETPTKNKKTKISHVATDNGGHVSQNGSGPLQQTGDSAGSSLRTTSHLGIPAISGLMPGNENILNTQRYNVDQQSLVSTSNGQNLVNNRDFNNNNSVLTSAAENEKFLESQNVLLGLDDSVDIPTNENELNNANLRVQDDEIVVADDGVKTYVCIICNKSFSSGHHLTRHKNSVHCEAKPFSCPKCGKPFKRRDHVLQHLNKKIPCIKDGVPGTADIPDSNDGPVSI